MLTRDNNNVGSEQRIPGEFPGSADGWDPSLPL